jgi:predicted DCC family thiol-disulfide oxidoreductase YuxK
VFFCSIISVRTEIAEIKGEVMNQEYPYTVFFDASCPLCRSEMESIALHDNHQRLILVDCSAAQFDDSPLHRDGITRQVILESLHVRDNCGAWIKGVSAFEAIYAAIGMTWMS